MQNIAMVCEHQLLQADLFYQEVGSRLLAGRVIFLLFDDESWSCWDWSLLCTPLAPTHATCNCNFVFLSFDSSHRLSHDHGLTISPLQCKLYKTSNGELTIEWAISSINSNQLGYLSNSIKNLSENLTITTGTKN